MSTHTPIWAMSAAIFGSIMLGFIHWDLCRIADHLAAIAKATGSP